MAPYYDMYYSNKCAGKENEGRLEFFADNDEEAVELAKQNFLEIAEEEEFCGASTLERVCRKPENILEKRYGVSFNKRKNLYSLKELDL